MQISQISAQLKRSKNIHVKDHWLKQCYQFLTKFKKDISGLALVEKVFEQFLVADLSLIGTGRLPKDVSNMQSERIPGQHILQVIEIVNIGGSLEKRFEDSANRLLKIFLTDGVQNVVGIEFQPIPQLSVLKIVPGTKILITNVRVRRGVLLLDPESIQILGGGVEELIQKFDQVRKQSVKSLLPQEWMDELGAIEAHDDDDFNIQREERDENNEDNLGFVETFNIQRIENRNRIDDSQKSRPVIQKENPLEIQRNIPLSKPPRPSPNSPIIKRTNSLTQSPLKWPTQQQPQIQKPFIPQLSQNRDIVISKKPLITTPKTTPRPFLPEIEDFDDRDFDQLIEMEENLYQDDPVVMKHENDAQLKHLFKSENKITIENKGDSYFEEKSKNLGSQTEKTLPQNDSNKSNDLQRTNSYSWMNRPIKSETLDLTQSPNSSNNFLKRGRLLDSPVKLENSSSFNNDDPLPLKPFTKIRNSLDREFSDSIKKEDDFTERPVKKLKFTPSQDAIVSYPISSPIEEPQQYRLAPIDSMFHEDNFSLFDETLEHKFSKRPYIYLSEKGDANIWIKGYLQSVVKGSFKSANNRFTMQANIEDGSDKITVTFDHAVLEPLIGLSVDEFHAFQVDNTKNSLLKSTLVEFQNKLKKIQGLFHIVNRFEDPLLIQIESPHSQTGNDLLNSLSNI